MGVIINDIGNLKNLEGFIHRREVDIKHLNMAYIGIGQAGGRIASDISRFGYYGVYINTCEQDLQEVENTLKSIYSVNNDNYKILRLLGYDGASKDRSIGLKAVKDNKELIKEDLISDEKLRDADFVWIVCSLGGGTGCGSVATIAQIVSGIIRNDKRIMVRKDKDGNVINPGKATVGIIAAIPDNNSSPKMKLNAAEALEEIKTLQGKRIIGSVMLIDNEKIINDFLQKPDTNNDWTAYGNATVASSIAELAMLTCLPGVETFDKSEMIDIWATPGFLCIGKNRLSHNWHNRTTGDKNSEADKIEEIVDVSFKTLGIFAEGYDFSYAVHGGMAIIEKENKIINSKQRILLQRALNKTLSVPEVIHFGVFHNDIFGTYLEPQKEKDEAILYTLAIINKLPERIFNMTENALKAKQTAMKRAGMDTSSLKDYIRENELIDLKEQNAVNNSFDLEDILNGEILTAPGQKEKENEELLKELF